DAYVVVKPPWIDIVANGGKRRSYVFQQDSAPLHKALKARVWMDRQEFSSTCHTTPNLARRGEGRRGEARGGRGEARGGKERLGVVEKEVTKHSHNTKSSSLKGAIARGMEEMNKDHRMKAFSQSLLDLNWVGDGSQRGINTIKPRLTGMFICFVTRKCNFQQLTVSFSVFLKVRKMSSDACTWSECMILQIGFINSNIFSGLLIK
ncbi:unnamed protein product, partial [Hymenolepis diminuta]